MKLCNVCKKQTTRRYKTDMVSVCKKCEMALNSEYSSLITLVRWDRLMKFKQSYPHLFQEMYPTLHEDFYQYEF